MSRLDKTNGYKTNLKLEKKNWQIYVNTRTLRLNKTNVELGKRLLRLNKTNVKVEERKTNDKCHA